MSSFISSRERAVWPLVHSSLLCGFLILLPAGISVFRDLQILEGNSDFVAHYTAARLVHQYGPSDLYDLELQKRVQREILRGGSFPGGLLPETHPPFEILLFAPLGYLPYRAAFVTWTILNGVSLLFLPWALSRSSPKNLGCRKTTVMLSALSFYPFAVCLWVGQDSIVYLWLVVFAYGSLIKGKEFRAGALLGLSFFRFPMSCLLVAPLLFKRRFHALSGLLLCLAGLMAIALALTGTGGLSDYWKLLNVLSSNPDGMEISVEGRMINWAGQLFLFGISGLHKSRGLVLALAGLCLIHQLWIGKWEPDSTSFGLRFAGTVMVSLLASPHHYMYDLSAVFLSAMLFLEYVSVAEGGGWRILAMSGALITFPWALFLSLPVAGATQIQLGVVWMTVMSCLALVQVRRIG